MDKALIKEAGKAFELSDIYLYSTSVSRFEEITELDHPDDMFQETKLSINVDYFEPKVAEKGARGGIHAKLSFGLRLVRKGGDDQPVALSEIEACFSARYFRNEIVSEAATEEFIKFNVVHNVWPFWREHAFRISAEARLPRPIISLFNDQSTPKKDHPDMSDDN